MIKFFGMAVIVLLSSISFAKSLSFPGGMKYKAQYVDGKGRAYLTMTGTPGVVIITRDSNKCETHGSEMQCNLAAFGNDVYGMPYRLRKTGETPNKLTYTADYIAPVDLPKGYDESYFRKLADIKIIITVSLDESNYGGGNEDLFLANKILMTFVGNSPTDFQLSQ